MSYEVRWTEPAEDELMGLWLAADDRDGLTAAVHGLEQRLARDPLHEGESRQSPLVRVLTEPPVGVDFELIEDDKRVLIQSVWAVG